MAIQKLHRKRRCSKGSTENRCEIPLPTGMDVIFAHHVKTKHHKKLKSSSEKGDATALSLEKGVPTKSTVRFLPSNPKVKFEIPKSSGSKNCDEFSKANFRTSEGNQIWKTDSGLLI